MFFEPSTACLSVFSLFLIDTQPQQSSGIPIKSQPLSSLILNAMTKRRAAVSASLDYWDRMA